MIPHCRRLLPPVFVFLGSHPGAVHLYVLVMLNQKTVRVWNKVNVFGCTDCKHFHIKNERISRLEFKLDTSCKIK